ncbi:MAG: metal-dependent transcriptional regulator [Candidatus Hermodarchaeota archaeon]
MITQTQEDYIRAVYLLKEKKGNDPSVSDIAKYLGLSRSTVWERLQTLVKNGLIDKESHLPVKLTEKGNKIARRLIWKHRIIEVFLHQFLDLDLEQTYEEAHRLEHAFSDESVKRLSQKLNNPAVCPHGYKILHE